MGLTPKKPVEASFRLESVRVLCTDGLVPIYEGEEGKIGNEISNQNTKTLLSAAMAGWPSNYTHVTKDKPVCMVPNPH